MAREKRWDVDVERYDLLDLSMSHSCVCARTHGCYLVRRYRETVSQQVPYRLGGGRVRAGGRIGQLRPLRLVAISTPPAGKPFFVWQSYLSRDSLAKLRLSTSSLAYFGACRYIIASTIVDQSTSLGRNKSLGKLRRQL